VGKGLSGGRIVVYPPKECPILAEENILVGNTVMYGAITGEAYFRGVAGERFCVRNSGATAVVEGVGDHGCEYMTGGRVLVLGRTGRNFGAGMSGGIAWVLDDAGLDATPDAGFEGAFERVCNREMVSVERLADPAEIDEVRGLLERHAQLTGSTRAREMLREWPAAAARFARVIPDDYRRVLEAQDRLRRQGLSPDEAALAAFQENTRLAQKAGGA